MSQESREYSDSRFERYRYQGQSGFGIETELTEDRFPEQDGCFYKGTFHFTESKSLQLSFPEFSFCKLEDGYWVWNEYPRIVLWFPIPAMIRTYHENGSLRSEIPVHWEVRSSSPGVELVLHCTLHQRVEWIVLSFHGPHEEIVNEIRNHQLIEDRHLTQHNLFDSGKTHNLMMYFVQDVLFHYSPQYPETLRYASEQSAHVLYAYADLMARQTGKRWYAVLRDEVAYTVLLSLPEDGRWRHSCWAGERETDLGYQLDGIDLLLCEYEAFGQSIFLEKARLAMAAVLSCADLLDDGTPWFLHDTLELDEALYQQCYEDSFLSSAFGKSLTNMLCLETHIRTLVLLSHLLEIKEFPEYRTALDGGLSSLERVLRADPAAERYGFSLRMRDRFRKIELLLNSTWTGSLIRRYNHRLRNRILPFLKKKHPRLLMPNGYLEGDLSATYMNDYSHLQSLKDLLLLYTERPEDWLSEIIQKSFQYSHRSGLVRWFAGQNASAGIFIEIILLYAMVIDDQVLGLLPEYLRLFNKLGIPLSLDSLAHSGIMDRTFTVQAEPIQVFLFTPLKKDRFIAVCVNPDSRAHTVYLNWNPAVKSKHLRFLFPDGSVKLAADKVFLSPREYVKIVR